MYFIIICILKVSKAYNSPKISLRNAGSEFLIFWTFPIPIFMTSKEWWFTYVVSFRTVFFSTRTVLCVITHTIIGTATIIQQHFLDNMINDFILAECDKPGSCPPEPHSPLTDILTSRLAINSRVFRRHQNPSAMNSSSWVPQSHFNTALLSNFQCHRLLKCNTSVW